MLYALSFYVFFVHSYVSTDDALDKDRQVFLKHVLQAKKVAQYQNPHIVCLVGCVTEQEPYSLLIEYPEQGDLLTYLRTERHEASCFVLSICVLQQAKEKSV